MHGFHNALFVRLLVVGLAAVLSIAAIRRRNPTPIPAHEAFEVTDKRAEAGA